MLSTSLINTDVAMKVLSARINDELLSCAEPLVVEALASIEKRLRKELGSLLISVVEQSYSIERSGNDLRITVRGNR